MRFLTTLSALSFASLSLAADITVSDAYAVSANPAAKSGGVFFMLENHSDADVTLISAETPLARKVELHTHLMTEGGAMSMQEVEGGITIPAGGCTILARGGFHVMLMGLNDGLADDQEVPVTLEFDNGETIEISPIVDRSRGGEYATEPPEGIESCYDAHVYGMKMGGMAH